MNMSVYAPHVNAPKTKYTGTVDLYANPATWAPADRWSARPDAIAKQDTEGTERQESAFQKKNVEKDSTVCQTMSLLRAVLSVTIACRRSLKYSERMKRLKKRNVTVKVGTRGISMVGVSKRNHVVLLHASNKQSSKTVPENATRPVGIMEMRTVKRTGSVTQVASAVRVMS